MKMLKSILSIFWSILTFIYSPYTKYQKFYVDKILSTIYMILEKNELITIKIKQNLRNNETFYKIFFQDSEILIKISPYQIYVKLNHQEFLEKYDFKNEELTKLREKIESNSGYVKIIDTISSEFYKQDNYYELFRIIPDDFKRNNNIDFFFEKKYKEKLFEVFENQCLFCRSQTNLHMDHFFVPKSKGGNFIMRTYSGLAINNAVLLCETCNKKKHAKSFMEFKKHIDFKYLKTKQFEMNKYINYLN